jgi:hypothetical protein
VCVFVCDGEGAQEEVKQGWGVWGKRVSGVTGDAVGAVNGGRAGKPPLYQPTQSAASPVTSLIPLVYLFLLSVFFTMPPRPSPSSGPS